MYFPGVTEQYPTENSSIAMCGAGKGHRLLGKLSNTLNLS